MNIFKRVTVMFLMAFSLFASANIFASEKDYIFFSDVASVKEFQKVVYNMGKTDSFEITTYALNVTNKNGFNIREFILKKPTLDRLLGMCSLKSNQLRSKVGIAPATPEDCFDVVMSTMDYRNSLTKRDRFIVANNAYDVFQNNINEGKPGWEDNFIEIVTFEKNNFGDNHSIAGYLSDNLTSTVFQGIVLDVFKDNPFYIMRMITRNNQPLHKAICSEYLSRDRLSPSRTWIKSRCKIYKN